MTITGFWWGLGIGVVLGFVFPPVLMWLLISLGERSVARGERAWKRRKQEPKE